MVSFLSSRYIKKGGQYDLPPFLVFLLYCEIVEMMYWTMSVPNRVGSTMSDGLVDILLGGAGGFVEWEPLGQLGSKGT